MSEIHVPPALRSLVEHQKVGTGPNRRDLLENISKHPDYAATTRAIMKVADQVHVLTRALNNPEIGMVNSVARAEPGSDVHKVHHVAKSSTISH